MRHERPKAAASTTAPSAASPPSNPRRSDLAPLKFGWEPFSSIAIELLPLLRRQHAELGINREVVPLDPDWDRYFEYERAGILKVWTARSDKTLVGFVDCFLTNSLLSRGVLYGFAEHFWLAPEWRSGRNGADLLKGASRAMVALGATVLRFNTNDEHEPDEHGRSRVGVLLAREGYKPVATIWEKAT